jgi:hypothetical protein
MAKHEPGKGAGKASEGRKSPPSSTRNERAQGGRKGSRQGGNPKVGKQETGTSKGDGLH